MKPSFLILILQSAMVVVLSRTLAGFSSTFCSLQANSQVYCFGDNTYGTLGDGTTTFSSIPIKMRGITAATDVSVGQDYVCVVDANQVKCIGLNVNSRLGDGTLIERHSLVRTNATSAKQVYCGNYHTCALLHNNNELACWGSNSHGQLGDGQRIERAYPTLIPTVNNIESIALGFIHTCIVANGGRVFCTGSNENAQLGDVKNLSNVQTFTPVVNLPSESKFVSLASGGFHVCAVDAKGNVWCWGSNEYGQLGRDDVLEINEPSIVQGLSGVASKVWCGVDNTFITLKHDDSVESLGFNDFGQLGSGNQTNSKFPVRFGNAQGIKEIAGGQITTCIVTVGDEVMCVGSNQLGKYTLQLVPVANLPITEAPTSSPTTSTGCTQNASSFILSLFMLLTFT